MLTSIDKTTILAFRSLNLLFIIDYESNPSLPIAVPSGFPFLFPNNPMLGFHV